MYNLPCCCRPCLELITVPKHHSTNRECSYILPAEWHKKTPDFPHFGGAFGCCSFRCTNTGLRRLSVHFKSRKPLRPLCRDANSKSVIWRMRISLVRAIGRGWASALETNGNVRWEGRISGDLKRTIWSYQNDSF